MPVNIQSIHALPIDELELQELREDQNAFMPDVCDIVRGTITTIAGQGSVAWGTVYSNVPCRFALRWWERAAEDFYYAEREASLQKHLFSLPWNTDVTEADRIVFHSTTYEIDFVSMDQSWRTVKRAYVFALSP